VYDLIGAVIGMGIIAALFSPIILIIYLIKKS
jgi:hypothetical protein